jgi:hypothetical protein
MYSTVVVPGTVNSSFTCSAVRYSLLPRTSVICGTVATTVSLSLGPFLMRMLLTAKVPDRSFPPFLMRIALCAAAVLAAPEGGRFLAPCCAAFFFAAEACACAPVSIADA